MVDDVSLLETNFEREKDTDACSVAEVDGESVWVPASLSVLLGTGVAVGLKRSVTVADSVVVGSSLAVSDCARVTVSTVDVADGESDGVADRGCVGVAPVPLPECDGEGASDGVEVTDAEPVLVRLGLALSDADSVVDRACDSDAESDTLSVSVVDTVGVGVGGGVTVSTALDVNVSLSVSIGEAENVAVPFDTVGSRLYVPDCGSVYVPIVSLNDVVDDSVYVASSVRVVVSLALTVWPSDSVMEGSLVIVTDAESVVDCLLIVS